MADRNITRNMVVLLLLLLLLLLISFSNSQIGEVRVESFCIVSRKNGLRLERGSQILKNEIENILWNYFATKSTGINNNKYTLLSTIRISGVIFKYM